MLTPCHGFITIKWIECAQVRSRTTARVSSVWDSVLCDLPCTLLCASVTHQHCESPLPLCLQLSADHYHYLYNPCQDDVEAAVDAGNVTGCETDLWETTPLSDAGKTCVVPAST